MNFDWGGGGVDIIHDFKLDIPLSQYIWSSLGVVLIMPGLRNL